MGPFSAVIREHEDAPEATTEYRYEVLIVMDDEPVLLSRQRLELRDDWHTRDRDFNIWKTVEPPTMWVERCKTLEDAQRLASKRTTVLNKLANLFDSDTAVSLYRNWECAGP